MKRTPILISGAGIPALANSAPSPAKSWLLLGHLTSLDAPAVAVSWLLLLGDCFHLTVARGNVAALFLTVWLIYLVDRFVDSRSLRSELPKSARQRFCLQQGGPWVFLIIIAAGTDAAVVRLIPDQAVLVRGMVLAFVVFAYLAINAACNRVWERVPIKEAMIGALFSAGTLLALNRWPVKVFLAGVVFALLCSMNCIRIAFWERDLDRIQLKHSIGTRVNNAGPLLHVLLGTSLAGSALLILADFQAWPLVLCIISSAAAISALEFVPCSRDERVALADLVLLTPIIVLAIRKVL